MSVREIRRNVKKLTCSRETTKKRMSGKQCGDFYSKDDHD